ncbi:TenA family protein [Cyanobium sp. CH-040]|uniref:TenA family protein n=1 Tax=Cyanobium sp. CH-040 TaxID=2823708 RepID=UPI0020CE723C|nr:TenA family protein [Cyanobium sp. CH-040]MCP9927528.1 TenA family protein [Cyanobium sp. CH-040]
MSASLAGQLWAGNADLARRTLEHPFVQGLGQGTLPRAAFCGYVAQDAYFLESFARAYALAIAHSPDRDSLVAFNALLQGVLEELRLHAGYASRWAIDLDATSPLPATTAYTEFLLATARGGDAGLICAAMTPCLRLYAWLGQQLRAQVGHPGHAYAEWIDTYADPAFAALARRLEALLDRLASPGKAVEATYRRAMELELAFFEAHAPG